MSIIERITQIMDSKNLNQSDLCKILGIKDSTFSTWKTRGTDPPAKYILLICEYLGVSVDYLLGRVDEPTATIKTVQGYVLPKILEEQNNLDELSKELLKTFKKLSFRDKISVLNYALNIESPPQIVQTKAPEPQTFKVKEVARHGQSEEKTLTKEYLDFIKANQETEDSEL